MGRLKFKRKRFVCHKCNKKGGKHYLLYKEGVGWACPLWEKRSVTDDDYPEMREG